MSQIQSHFQTIRPFEGDVNPRMCKAGHNKEGQGRWKHIEERGGCHILSLIG